MKDQNNHIDDLFKKGLGSYTETPPPAVWDALEKRLDGKQRKRGGYYPWFISLLLLACISLLGGTIWKLNDNSHGVTKAIAAGETAVAAKPGFTEDITTSSNTATEQNETKNKQNTVIGKENISPNTIVKNVKCTKPDINETKPQRNDIITDKTNAVEKHTNDNVREAITQVAETKLSKNTEIAETTKPVAPTSGQAKANEIAAITKAANASTIKPVEEKTLNALDSSVPAGLAKDDKQDAVVKTTANDKATSSKKAVSARTTASPVIKMDASPAKIEDPKHELMSAKGLKKLDVSNKVIPASSLSAVPHFNETALSTSSVLEDKTVAREGAAKQVAKEPVYIAKPIEKTSDISRDYVSLSKIAPKQLSFRELSTNPVFVPQSKELLYEAKEVPVKEEIIAGTFKNDNVPNSKSGTIYDDTRNNGKVAAGEVAQATKILKLEIGIKAGYEAGFGSSAASKYVISPYVQYDLNNKFAVALQPSVNIASNSYKDFGATQSFYKKDLNSNTFAIDSTPIYNAEFDTVGYGISYRYSQKHDSVVKSYSAGGSYLEFSLPVLLKYKLSPKFSVFAGVSVTLSKYIPIKENTYTSSNILVSRSTPEVLVFDGNPMPVAPPIESVIQYSTSPVSNYTGPLYPSQSGDLFRFGYTLGFSYEFRKRWLFDAMMQQSSAKSNVQGGYDTNSPLTLPYFRVTLGYKLGNISIPFFK